MQFQFIKILPFIIALFNPLNKQNLKPVKLRVSDSQQKFVNTIVTGDKCFTFGYDKYVQNSDATAAYTVTLKVVSFKAGVGAKEFQKVIDVPAGGKTYAGCTASQEIGGPTYTYTVVGESKK